MVVLAFTVLVAAADPAPAAPTESASPAVTPSLVDHVVTKALIEQGRAASAKAVMPSARVPGVAAKPADAASDLAKGEELLKKKDAKAALLAFRRALARAPKSAAPLWGMSRAADALGDAASARRYAALYVNSTAKDKDANTAAAARWRLEQPDENAPATAPTPTPLQPGPTAIPTSATPPLSGQPAATPPAPTPY